MPDEDRWQQIWDVFHGALERPARQRSAYLEAACRGDSALGDEVRSLLAEHEPSSRPRRNASGSGHLLDRGLRFTPDDVLGDDLPGVPPDRIQRAQGSLESHAGQRYRLLNVLGSGGMGEVYRTLDRLTGRIVALKKILPSTAGAGPLSTSAETLTAPAASCSEP